MYLHVVTNIKTKEVDIEIKCTCGEYLTFFGIDSSLLNCDYCGAILPIRALMRAAHNRAIWTSHYKNSEKVFYATS